MTSEGESKQLEVNLAKPLTGTSELIVRSQTALGSFPLEVQGMSLVPDQAIRHSGFLRISNVGSVRVEPTEITGLTQLAPEQFPGEPLKGTARVCLPFSLLVTRVHCECRSYST